MTNEKYAIFLDIDNTLMANGVVPKENIDEIRRVRENGSFVFINTARSHACIPEFLKNGLETDGIVCGIGTDLRLRGKQIFSRCMSKEELKKITSLFLKSGKHTIYEGEDMMLYLNYDDSDDEKKIKNTVKSPDDFDSLFSEVKISKMYIEGSLSEYEIEQLSDVYTVYQHEYYSEFVTKGFDKALGMKMMLGYIDIDEEHVIAMGDSSNDADMLSAAHISVAMGNAIPEIKEMCTFVSLDSSDGGVAAALKKYI